MKKVITTILCLLAVIFTANAVDMRYLPKGIYNVNLVYHFVQGITLDDVLDNQEYVIKHMEPFLADENSTIRIKSDGFIILMLPEHLDTMQLISVKQEKGGKPGYIYAANDNKSLKVIQVKNVYYFYWENEDGVIIFTIDT